MYCCYPNLELLDYKTREYLKEIDPEKYRRLDLEADVFTQQWASTALGFPGVGGSAITTAYTSVFSDFQKGVAVVYFDGILAYIKEDYHSSEEFLDDLKKRHMLSIIEAQQSYGKVLTNYVD